MLKHYNQRHGGTGLHSSNSSSNNSSSNSGSSSGSNLFVNQTAFITYAWDGFIFYFTWNNYYQSEFGTYDTNVTWKFYHTQTNPTTIDGIHLIVANETPFATSAPAQGDYMRYEVNSKGAGTTQYLVSYQKSYTPDLQHMNEHWTYNTINYTNLGAMDVTFNNSIATFNTAATGSRRVIEYNMQNYNPLPNYTQQVKDIFYMSSCRSFETGPYDSGYASKFYKWTNGTHTIKLQHNASTSPERQTLISNAVNNWITKTNAVIGSVVYWVRDDNTTTPDILVTSGTHLEHWGYTPNEYNKYTYGGTWGTFNNGININSANVLINNGAIDNPAWPNFDCIVMEELYQSLGAGNDMISACDYINTEFNWRNKNPNAVYNAIDTGILQLMYLEPSITSNMTAIQMATAINPTYAIISGDDVSSINLGTLQTGTYNMRYFQSIYVDPLDSITSASAWQSVYVVHNARPAPWVWSVPLTSGSTHGILTDNANEKIYILSAAEFNAFVDHVKAVRDFYGYTLTIEATATQYATFNRNVVNILRLRLNAMGATGTPEYISSTTKMKGEYFLKLANAVNSIN